MFPQSILYQYLYKKDPMNYFWKDFINKFGIIKIRLIKENDETLCFKIIHNNNLLNIFFDKDSYDIKGWRTTDVYLNKVETKLLDIETNKMIDKKLFRVQNYIN